MKNILHISCDEKFIDMGINAFELAYPSCNKLILVKSDNNVQHVAFKNREVKDVKELARASKKRKFWHDVDVVILHSLFTHKICIPKGIRVIWLGFGFDYYDLIISDKAELLSLKNRKLLNKSSINESSLKNKVKSFLKFVLFHEGKKKYQKRKIIERVDIFCPVLTSEYKAIRWHKKKKPKLMDWNYGTMEDNWAKAGFNPIDGNNVLLGNSATTTCNHIDGIDLINEIEDFQGKLIIPLSYGDQAYKELIKDYLHHSFKGEAMVLEDFMPFDEYTKIISTCSLVVMPHKRQQGLGNILMLMNLGAKIFLDKDNLLYTYLIEQGFVVYTLEDISQKCFQDKLAENQIENNRRLLFETWGRQSIIDKTISLIECELD